MFNRKKIAALEARNQVLMDWVERNVKETTNLYMTFDKTLEEQARLRNELSRLTAKVEPTTIKVHDITSVDLAYQIRKEFKVEQKSAGIGGKEFYQVPVSFIDGVILGAKDEVKE